MSKWSTLKGGSQVAVFCFLGFIIRSVECYRNLITEHHWMLVTNFLTASALPPCTLRILLKVTWGCVVCLVFPKALYFSDRGAWKVPVEPPRFNSLWAGKGSPMRPAASREVPSCRHPVPSAESSVWAGQISAAIGLCSSHTAWGNFILGGTKTR